MSRFSAFYDNFQDSEEKFTVEEIEAAGEKMVEKIPEESEDAREYMRAAVQIMIQELEKGEL